VPVRLGGLRGDDAAVRAVVEVRVQALLHARRQPLAQADAEVLDRPVVLGAFRHRRQMGLDPGGA
jgi:hypothetical protein